MVLREEMKDRRQFLEEIIKKYKKEFEGYNKEWKGMHLGIHWHGRSVVYYARKDGEKSGSYLSKKRSKEIIRMLAQKDYSQKIIEAALQELSVLETCADAYPNVLVEEIQNQYAKEVLELITPCRISDEQYAKAWQEESYTQSDIYREHCIYATKRGEMVRSKSEVLIADALNYEKIPYYYERPLYIDNIGTCHPDFTVLNVGTRQEYIWEHFGMMSDPEYAMRAVKKIQKYQNSGYILGKNFIATFEDVLHPLTPDLIKETMRAYLL